MILTNLIVSMVNNCASTAPPSSSYSTSFTSTENPISEGGAWTQAATDWQDVRTTGGYATGAAYTENFDDCYARLTTATFAAPSDNYEIVATVRKVSEAVANSEIELLLRVVDTATTINAYEVLVNTGGSCELVRWNGTMGTFFEIASTATSITGWTGNGDKVKARVTGTNPAVVTVSHAPASDPTNFTQVFQYSDTDATRKQTGQPGIAFYQHAADNNLLNAGWSDFAVTAI